MALVNVAWIVVLASLALCFPTVRTMLDAVRRNVKEDRRGDLRRLAVDLLTPDKHENPSTKGRRLSRFSLLSQ